MSMKVVMESARQRLHVGEKTFKPTPNVRNPAMLLEAEEFARHLNAYKHMLLKYERRINSFLSSVPVVGRSNLPRVWEAVEGTNMAGGDFDELLMADAAEIMRRRVDAIVRPIDRWLESLKVVQARMKKLEGLRMQVDARRRRVHARFLAALRRMTASEAASMRAEVASAGSNRYGRGTGMSEEGEPADMFSADASDVYEGEDDDLERQRDREDYAREALNQHRQLEAVAESYREQEQLVYEQLSGLVRDAAYFKSYVAAGLLVVKDTLVATLVALGPAKRPLPGFSDREVEGEEVEGAYGRSAALNDLIEDLPPVAADDLSGPEARLAPVPTVIKSASAIPTDRLAAALGSGQEGLSATELGAGDGFGPKTPQDSLAGPTYVTTVRTEVAAL
ncbi:hypothetical protein QJQ45_008270 [Haematococcus lacustris]|nr:hypothetical protein QJQ45_008270 [Haematococcus lacustris]